MYLVKAKTFTDAYVGLCDLLLIAGSLRNARGLACYDLSPCLIEIEYPFQGDIADDLPQRRYSKAYRDAEMAWYESGDPNIKNIAKYASLWERICDSSGNVNSNYGHYVNYLKVEGRTQYEWCLNSLVNDIHSRQAVINYNMPMHKYDDNADFVCTLSQSFIMNDWKLDCFVNMRSNDLIYGLSYDYYWFISILNKLCDDINIGSGKYVHFANSLHVYEQHFDMIREIVNKNKERLKSVVLYG